LTAAHGIDHARSLSIVLPAVMKVLREDKRSKLLQYAERIWNITVADEDEKIDQAIAKTEAFFKAMEVPTTLTEAGITAGDIDNLIAKLEKHGMVALGERKNITLEVSRKILETAL
ncbi:MAG: iron-containing alcohol dehydrogenase, partial [Moritella sp.]